MLLMEYVILYYIGYADRFQGLFTIFHNKKRTADDIYGEILKEKRNIVLIGMPGSGKSTIGKALAETLGKEFIDTDDMITSSYGVISVIFESEGESRFRDIETEQVKIASKMNGKVIATGGGAVLRKENIDALKQNGVKDEF